MKNPTLEGNYEEMRRKAKEFYGKISHVWCPALNDEVTFNTAGFHHLIWKQGKKRKKAEQIKRFTLVPDIRAIIGDATNIVAHRQTTMPYSTYHRGKRKTKIVGAEFWELRNNKGITVIVRQMKGGAKHFFSVFSK
jgi:hypothetical protein